MKSADKMFMEAERLDQQGDEEKAFIMYMRYFNIVKQVKTNADYRKNKVGDWERWWLLFVGCLMSQQHADSKVVVVCWLLNADIQQHASVSDSKVVVIRWLLIVPATC